MYIFSPIKRISLRKTLLGIEESKVTGRDELLNSKIFKKLNKPQKYFFGTTASKAIEAGYRFTRKSYFEAVQNPLAIATAKKIKNLLADIKYKRKLKILEPFTGSGQTACAFAKEGFNVLTYEIHHFTHQCALRNFRLAHVLSKVDSSCSDGYKVLNAHVRKNTPFAAIYLDPDWKAIRHKYPSFSLKFTTPKLDRLVRLCVKISPIVAFKVPRNIDLEEVSTLGRKLNQRTIIQFQDIKGFRPKFCQATIYLIRKKFDITKEYVQVSTTGRILRRNFTSSLQALSLFAEQNPLLVT